MVHRLNCECEIRYETDIESYQLFEQIKDFFEVQVKLGIYKENTVTTPFYIGYSPANKNGLKWFATKWYICKLCGCLWEFNYPDFPAHGFVRKFSDGKYQPK